MQNFSLTCQSCRYGHVVTEQITVISEKTVSASVIDGQLNCGVYAVQVGFSSLG